MKAVLFLLVLVNSRCAPDESKVYVCHSKSATRYHYSKTCRGLSNCTYRIIKITEKEAKAAGKTLCGWEKQQHKRIN